MSKKRTAQVARTKAAKEVPNPQPEEVPPVKDPDPSLPPQEIPHVPESTPPPQPREVPSPVDPPEPTPPNSAQIGGSKAHHAFCRRGGQIRPSGIADAYRRSLLNRSRTISIT